MGKNTYIFTKQSMQSSYIYVISASSLLQRPKPDRPLSSSNSSGTDIVEGEEL